MKKGTVRFILFVFIAFILYNSVSLLRPDVKTQIAQSGSLEKSFSLEGMVARNEVVIKTQDKGVLESRVKENEMVKKNKVVASVYKGEIDDESQRALSEINQRINELASQSEESSHSNDAQKIEESITSKINDIIIASNNGDGEKISYLKENLQTLYDKKAFVSGSNAESSSVLADLKSKKAYYENQLNAKRVDLSAPMAGLYSTNIDGFEEALSSDNIKDIKVSDYQMLKKKKFSKEDIKNSGAVCKIVDNYQWSIVTTVNDSTASELEIDREVYIRFKNTKENIPARVAYISKEESNKYVVAFVTTTNNEYALANRFVEFDVICDKYTGIKIPVSTISVKDNGTTGVYVVSSSILRFKEVNILFKNSKYAIVEQNNMKENYLLLYDEIVTHCKEYTEGKKVR